MLVTFYFLGYLVDVKPLMAAELLQSVCLLAVDDEAELQIAHLRKL